MVVLSPYHSLFGLHEYQPYSNLPYSASGGLMLLLICIDADARLDL